MFSQSPLEPLETGFMIAATQKEYLSADLLSALEGNEDYVTREKTGNIIFCLSTLEYIRDSETDPEKISQLEDLLGQMEGADYLLVRGED